MFRRKKMIPIASRPGKRKGTTVDVSRVEYMSGR